MSVIDILVSILLGIGLCVIVEYIWPMQIRILASALMRKSMHEIVAAMGPISGWRVRLSRCVFSSIFLSLLFIKIFQRNIKYLIVSMVFLIIYATYISTLELYRIYKGVTTKSN